jgi:hypothetical protein
MHWWVKYTHWAEGRHPDVVHNEDEYEQEKMHWWVKYTVCTERRAGTLVFAYQNLSQKYANKSSEFGVTELNKKFVCCRQGEGLRECSLHGPYCVTCTEVGRWYPDIRHRKFHMYWFVTTWALNRTNVLVQCKGHKEVWLWGEESLNENCVCRNVLKESNLKKKCLQGKEAKIIHEKVWQLTDC